MSWPELRNAIDTQINLFGSVLRQWQADQNSLSEAQGRLHATLESAHHQLARDGLQAADVAPSHARKAAEHLTRAIQLCRDYLHAVDPDNADGSIRGLEAPVPHGATHGGHGGPGVAPARRPVTDPSRRRSHVYTEQGGPDGLADLQTRDDGILETRRAWLRCAGHAVDRHGGAITDQQLQGRAFHGNDPMTGNKTDWEHGQQHLYGRHATAFTTDAALVYSEMRVHDSPESRSLRHATEEANGDRYTVRVPAARILGPDFRDHLHGWSRVGSKKHPTGTTPTHFPDSTEILTVYQRDPGGEWYAYTCYPSIP